MESRCRLAHEFGRKARVVNLPTAASVYSIFRRLRLRRICVSTHGPPAFLAVVGINGCTDNAPTGPALEKEAVTSNEDFSRG